MLDLLKKTFIRKRTLILLLAVIGKVCLSVAKNSSYFAEEIFAKYIFKAMSQGIAFITGIFPFSVAEVSIIAAPFLALALIVGFVVKFVKNKKNRPFLALTFLLNCLCMASIVYFFYSFGCGINYHRYDLAQHLELEVRPSSKEELAELVAYLADKAGETREKLDSFTEDGVYELKDGHRALGRQARQAYVKLGGENPLFGGFYPGPKPVMLSHYMSYTHIIGIYTCWTMEANVDVDISDYAIGYTMCHELAHLRGFIKEDEANFISYLACTGSESPELQYSGYAEAFIYAANELSRKDSKLYGKVVSDHYYPGMWKDFEANSAYWKQFEHAAKVAEITEKANDVYITSNDVEDGVESYGRVVDLLLAMYRKERGM